MTPRRSPRTTRRDNAFTGKILKVTVDVKAMGAGTRAEAAQAGAEAARKAAAAAN